jgi:hypothetical protein
MTRTRGSAGHRQYLKVDLHYTVRRATVTCEVLNGTGALWRMENPSRPDELSAESHQLALILEAPPGCTLNAAGYFKARSEVQWLSSSVGRLFENLGDAFRKFFNDGAPVEAFGEWHDIIPR